MCFFVVCSLLVSQCIELDQQYPVCVSHDLEGVYVDASLLVNWHGSVDLSM